MKTQKTTFILTISIALLSCLSSCDDIKKSIQNTVCPPQEAARNIIVLADYSASIPKGTAEWYLATIADEVIPALERKDNLIVLPVDYGSLTSSTEVFNTKFDKVTFSTAQVNELQKKSHEQQQFLKFKMDSILPGLKHAFESAYLERSKYNKGTDLLGALSQSKGYLKNNDRNLIIVFSDMIQETELVNLEKNLKSDDQITGLLEKSSKVSLSNADVIVLTGEQPNISIPKFNRIKYYWEKLAERDGWNLLEYNSGGKQALRNWLNGANEKSTAQLN